MRPTVLLTTRSAEADGITSLLNEHADDNAFRPLGQHAARSGRDVIADGYADGMARSTQPAPCSIQRATDVLGDRWTLLILREALFGRTRYSEFQRNLGVAPDVLSAKLSKLVDEGLLQRQTYQQDGQRERREYRLTPDGLVLHPLIAALSDWGEAMRPISESRAPRFAVADTGEPVTLAFVSAGGDVVDPLQVTLQSNSPLD